jgi:hypothetical protein
MVRVKYMLGNEAKTKKVKMLKAEEVGGGVRAGG